jgi:alpha-mannosidase
MKRSDDLKQAASRLGARQNHLVDRFLAEMECVEGLGRLHPKQARAWAALAERAWGLLEEAVRAGRTDDVDEAVRAAERVLAPVGAVAKTYTVHCVGHAHIDMNWMWSWAETVNATNDTFLTMLKLMEEFPDFCFTQSQASVYEIVERYHPEMLQAIRRRVKEGRWEVVASYWVEAEKNLAGGEALARQMLLTRRYLKRLFGLGPEDVPIDWSPDTFGHPHTIPSINARGGARWCYLCRGGAGWSRPPVFWFQGPDGSRVLVNHETTWYNDSIGPHNLKAVFPFCEKTGLRDFMRVYGVGDHGGGPTRRDIIRCHDMDQWPIFPRYRLGTAGAFFRVLEANGDRWPTLDRELNFEFPGCYTSQSLVKRNNRLGEIYAGEAEQVAALAGRLAGRPYPAEMLERVWRDVCFSHFHDILPGSGVAATRRYNDGMFQRLAAATSLIRVNSLRAAAARIDTRCGLAEADLPALTPDRESVAMGAGPGRDTMHGGLSSAAHVVDGPRPYVVFNPTGFAREDVVVATVWDPQTGIHGDDLSNKHYVVRYADGSERPAQKLNQGDWYWGNRFVDIAFPAKVGPLGYAACAALDDGTRFKAPYGASGYERIQSREFEGGVKTTDVRMGVEGMPVGGYAMENEHLIVDFDARTGGISRLVDKATGVDLADAAHPMGVLEYELERAGGMSAWTIYDTYRTQTAEVPSFTKGPRGPWVASVTAKTRLGGSEASVTYTLRAGQPWVEIKVWTRWVEIGNGGVGTPKLRIRFPMALQKARATYEIPYGTIERRECRGEEVPGLRWADVCGSAAGGKKAGCAVLNDGKHGHSLDGRTLKVSLIRSSHDPDPIPEVRDHEMRLAVVPHGMPLSKGRLMQMGAAFNQPLQVLNAELHGGDLPGQAALVDVAPEGVVLTALKKAEDDEDLVLRLVEVEGRATTAKVTLHPALTKAITRAVGTDFLERELRTKGIRVAGRTASVRVGPHAIVSLKVRLARA